MMKGFTSTLTYFIRQEPKRRNIAILLRFFLVLGILVVIYTTIFLHLMKHHEGETDVSWIDGFYWTLTVMSTLGFGDIVFHSDLGRLFSMIVLLSGMIFLLVLMPFTFIEFFYAPWMEAQSAARAPRGLNKNVKDHIILTHYGPVTASLITKLKHYGYPYVLLVSDLQEALRLHDIGIHVVVGDLDDPRTYRNTQAEKAALVATTSTDVINTNVTFTVREMTEEVPIVATANNASSVEILKLAGSNDVLQLGEMMGQSLARRTIGGDALAHEIGRFGELAIAEATASGTPLVGKTLRESQLREIVGVTVIGVWERGYFEAAGPETRIGPNTVLVMAGSSEQFRRYDELFCIYHLLDTPVVIIGGGRVGRATGRALANRNMDYRIIEQLPERVRDATHYIVGNAADLEVIEKAGINEAPTVIVSTHEDDTNIYLTLFCRKLRPDIQIISRATLERNVSTLHRAGADFVMSYASMGANNIFNLLQRSDVVMLAEGLNVIRVRISEALRGRTLSELPIRKETGCSVVALRRNSELTINPDPNMVLEPDAEMVLIGTAEAEQRFLSRYGNKISRYEQEKPKTDKLSGHRHGRLNQARSDRAGPDELEND